ncbi:MULTISPECIES: cytochrome c [unclassified Phenylobacterium]|nr:MULTISPECIES: cytochrome c [unclassified Phenylobacterium]
MQATSIAVGAALLVACASPAAAQSANGATIYNRCAACHTATGAGVPGAYPPLGVDFRQMAAKPDGRRYLVAVVTRGLAGPLTVDGKSYRGVMPAQAGLNDASIAAVLNHVGSKIATTGPAFRLFTEAEVAKHRASAADLNGAAVAKLHAYLRGAK